MTIKNKNQIILLASFLLLLGISYILAISFGENLVKEKYVFEKVLVNEDPVNTDEKLEIDVTLVSKYLLKEGSNFTSILKEANLEDNQIDDIVNSISEKIDLRKLKVGTLIETYTTSIDGKNIVNEIIIYPDN